MTSQEFTQFAKNIVHSYARSHLDVTDNVQFAVDDVYIVWQCYILGNIKALLSTTLADGMYYEVTYNSNTDEAYLDAYKKWDNMCFGDIGSHEHIDDKQTRQKVISIDPEIIDVGDDKLEYPTVACPRCGKHIQDVDDNWRDRYCSSCGQALDWGDVKDD